MATLGMDAHLTALDIAGYDLETLVNGAAPGTIYRVTPEQLVQSTHGKIPIGACVKIMQGAEAIAKKKSK